MASWKLKLCGDNRFNFYGWIGGGLFVMVASLWFVIRAIQAGAFHSPVSLLLGAIYFVLLGHFGIALQNYCARVAKHLESKDKEDDKTRNT
jgi:hypothetical protein